MTVCHIHDKPKEPKGLVSTDLINFDLLSKRKRNLQRQRSKFVRFLVLTKKYEPVCHILTDQKVQTKRRPANMQVKNKS